MPPSPYRQTPRIYRGHGVWITPPASEESGKAGAPILLSTLDWIEGAKELSELVDLERLRDVRPADGFAL